MLFYSTRIAKLAYCSAEVTHLHRLKRQVHDNQARPHDLPALMSHFHCKSTRKQKVQESKCRILQQKSLIYQPQIRMMQTKENRCIAAVLVHGHLENHQSVLNLLAKGYHVYLFSSSHSTIFLQVKLVVVNYTTT